MQSVFRKSFGARIAVPGTPGVYRITASGKLALSGVNTLPLSFFTRRGRWRPAIMPRWLASNFSSLEYLWHSHLQHLVITLPPPWPLAPPYSASPNCIWTSRREAAKWIDAGELNGWSAILGRTAEELQSQVWLYPPPACFDLPQAMKQEPSSFLTLGNLEESSPASPVY